MASLGAKVNKLRMKSKRSLQQLADEVGVSKAHIYELESNKVKNPSIEVLKTLAKIFEVPITFFLEDDADLEMTVMFRDLKKDMASLSPEDLKTLEVMVEVLKKRKETENGN